MTEEPSPLTLSRTGITLIVVVEAVFVFFLAQATLRLFSMRDTINELQTEVARVQVRQEQLTVLMQNKLDNMQRQIDRIEQNR